MLHVRWVAATYLFNRISFVFHPNMWKFSMILEKQVLATWWQAPLVSAVVHDTAVLHGMHIARNTWHILSKSLDAMPLPFTYLGDVLCTFWSPPTDCMTRSEGQVDELLSVAPKTPRW